MITKKEYKKWAKENPEYTAPLLWAVISEMVECHGCPEKEANDWFVFQVYGRMSYPFVFTTLGKIPFYRCHWEEAKAKEEANIRNKEATEYLERTGRLKKIKRLYKKDECGEAE